MFNAEPVVKLADVILNVFFVVCEEVISNEAFEVAAVDVILTPYPSSAKTLRTVEPVAEACSCLKSTTFLVPVSAPVDSTNKAEPVVNAEAVTSITVPVVIIESIITAFAVVCSESISSEGRPAARLESTKIPRPPSD